MLLKSLEETHIHYYRMLNCSGQFWFPAAGKRVRRGEKVMVNRESTAAGASARCSKPISSGGHFRTSATVKLRKKTKKNPKPTGEPISRACQRVQSQPATLVPPGSSHCHRHRLWIRLPPPLHAGSSRPRIGEPRPRCRRRWARPASTSQIHLPVWKERGRKEGVRERS